MPTEYFTFYYRHIFRAVFVMIYGLGNMTSQNWTFKKLSHSKTDQKFKQKEDIKNCSTNFFWYFSLKLSDRRSLASLPIFVFSIIHSSIVSNSSSFSVRTSGCSEWNLVLLFSPALYKNDLVNGDENSRRFVKVKNQKSTKIFLNQQKKIKNNSGVDLRLVTFKQICYYFIRTTWNRNKPVLINLSGFSTIRKNIMFNKV
ncbi:hypothetical protein BpHYR1_029782 [Brachionus plicatilis]|uniref:Uncharacterized protein n=1 Tax=Brachionus plicatilis TaxID=10195 RepID=A0A3M7RAN6_BRAPC|nr:hypothetical protein BpHYR1_029782 [Brachionus plicatilis]